MFVSFEEESVDTSQQVTEKEDLLPTGFVKCPVEGCGEIIRTKGRFAHFRIKHPDLNYQDYKNSFVPAPAPHTESPKERDRKGGSIYRGDADYVEIIKEVLEHHPDIPERVVEEVVSWAEYGVIHPAQLYAVLTSMKDVKPHTAYIVAQKYTLALMKAQSEGRLLPPFALTQLPFPQQSQMSQLSQLLDLQMPLQMPNAPAQVPSIRPISGLQMPLFGQQQMNQSTPPPPPTPPASLSSEEKIKYIIRDELERIIKDREKSQDQESTIFVDIEEPVRDSKGNVIIGPDDKPIMKRMRVPASQATAFVEQKKEDEEIKLLEKLKIYKDLFAEKKTEQVIPERPGPSITPEDLSKAMSEAVSTALQKVIEMRQKEEESERRHKELLSAIQSMSSSRMVEGYKDDSMRVLGQGLSEVAQIVRERKPIEVVIRDGLPSLLGQPRAEVKEKVGESDIFNLLPPELVHKGEKEEKKAETQQ